MSIGLHLFAFFMSKFSCLPVLNSSGNIQQAFSRAVPWDGSPPSLGRLGSSTRFLYWLGDISIDLRPIPQNKIPEGKAVWNEMKRVWDLGLEDPSKMNFVFYLCSFLAVKLDTAVNISGFQSHHCKIMLILPSSNDCHKD